MPDRAKRQRYRPSLRLVVIAILLLALLPPLAVATRALVQAGQSYRMMSQQNLEKTAHILAQATIVELKSWERVMRVVGENPGAIAQLEFFTSYDRLEVVAPQGAEDVAVLSVELRDHPAAQTLAALVYRAAKSQAFEVSDLVDGGEGGGLQIALALPDKNRAGGVALALAQPLKVIGSLRDLLDGEGDPLVMVVDGAGRIIDRSRDGEKFAGMQVPDWARLQSIEASQTGLSVESFEGSPLLIAYAPIEGTQGWWAVAGEPEQIFEARWKTPLRKMVLTALLTAAAALMLALFLVARLLRPIRGLVARAKVVSETGRVDARALRHTTPIKSPIKEFAVLNESLAAAEARVRRMRAASQASKIGLRHSLLALERAEKLARIGSWSLDAATGEFTFSAMLRELHGISPEKKIFIEDLAAMMPAPDYEVLSKAIAVCLRDGTAYSVDLEHFTASGGRFRAEVRGDCNRDGKGNIIGASGTVLDVTAREAAHAQLVTLADSLPDGAIFSLAAEDETAAAQIIYLSAGISQLLDLSSEALFENPALWRDVVTEDGQAVIAEKWHEAFRNKTGMSVDFQLKSAEAAPEKRDDDATDRLPEGGSKPAARWLQMRIAPRQGSKGKIWDGVLLDVSDEYEAAEALRHAKESAEAAERAKSEFLATMSHEIRTPMNSVIGMTRLALQTDLQPKQLNYLEKINDSANLLMAIINDILDFSKIEAGGMVLEAAPFKLDTVLKTVSSVSALRAEEKGLDLRIEIDAEMPRFWRGDALRLGQVLNNLVSNAIKFTEKGEVVVSVSSKKIVGAAQADAQNLHELSFQVKDSGIGLSAAQMQSIFTPFQQADTSTARKYGGTGLGLAICRSLAELMEGEISVESSVGQGSTFTFTAICEALSAPSLKDRGLVTTSALHGRRVLVVDDNEASRLQIAELVESFGMHAVVVQNGAEALSMLKSTNGGQGDDFDLVLSDWRMPEMDGVELAKKIRADQSLADIPAVLMMTAYGHQLVLNEASRADVAGVLLKPITRSTIFNTLQDLFDHGGAEPDTDVLSPSKADPKRAQLLEILRGSRVLVVDDNALNREVASELLALMEVEVSTAENGRDAIKALQQNTFDAVLMDVHMPIMDGLEAVREIRQHKKWQDLPVIALTAQARPEDHRTSLEAGMSAHLTKPVDEENLYQVLAQFAQQNKGVKRQHRSKSLSKATTKTKVKTKSKASAAQSPKQAENPATYKPNLAQMQKRFGNSDERLLRFVNGFMRDFGDMAERFKQMDLEQDLSEIAEFAHRVKGVVGYVGADELFEFAALVETAARAEDAAQLKELAPHFTHLMQDCVAGLQMMSSQITQIARNIGQGGGNPTALSHAITALEPLVAAGDFSARDKLVALLDRMPDPSLRQTLERGLEQFEDLELIAAVSTLRELAGQLQAGGGQ